LHLMTNGGSRGRHRVPIERGGTRVLPGGVTRHKMSFVLRRADNGVGPNPDEVQLALGRAPPGVARAMAPNVPREASTARLPPAYSRFHRRRRTLSEPRSNEPIAQKPVTIMPSAIPATNEMSST